MASRSKQPDHHADKDKDRDKGDKHWHSKGSAPPPAPELEKQRHAASEGGQYQYTDERDLAARGLVRDKWGFVKGLK